MASPAKKSRPVNRRSQLQKWPDGKEILSERDFRQMMRLEEKRSRRMQRPFAVLLMNAGRTLPVENNVGALPTILSALQANTRETDLIGWYETDLSVGVMFTEITVDNGLVLSALLSRISATLRAKLTPEQFRHIKVSCVLFPEELGRIHPVGEKNVALPMTYAATVASAGWGPTPE